MNEKILIVDDNPTNIIILEELLEEFTLETAEDGLEAIEKLKGFRADLVILDIMMPRMDGYEVCKHIRSNEDLRFTKIIFVSAKALLEERLRGYKIGADDYVTKPFDHDELLAKVRVFLRLKYVEENNQMQTDVLESVSRMTRAPLNTILKITEAIMSDNRLAMEEVTSSARQIQTLTRQIAAALAEGSLVELDSRRPEHAPINTEAT